MKLKNEMHRLVQALKKKEKKTTTQKVKSVNMSTEKKGGSPDQESGK
jgi:hypothetical protein